MSFILCFFFCLLFFALFYFLMKDSVESFSSFSVFECGFTSYFFSRFSFSVHYFYISIIFLFMDLELCTIMPFFNYSSSSFNLYLNLIFFLFVLLVGLLEEWLNNKLNWSF